MAKIIFCVPPVKTSKGFAQATQNRQYQFFKDPTYIFPVIPATFLTMLVQTPGYEVLLVDSVAEDISEDEFGKLLVQMSPDYIIFESNTMLINRYIEVIKGIKENLPQIKIVLTGEHVTAMPDDCKARAKADFFIQGGKWYKEVYKIITGKDWEGKLPIIDRNASRWYLYAYNNGNFKYLPATYTMAAQDCWYRPSKPCTFCTWVDYHPENSIRSVDDFLDEVQGLINFGFKEFFDDSGTFPVGKWLKEFCDRMTNEECEINGKPTTMNKHIVWGCNMRFKALNPEDFKMMAEAGCRFILWGYESANQKTLDMLSKGYHYKDMSESLIAAKMAGIWNHLTVMMGYPWETLQEEMNTFKMVKWLLLNDWASSMQATIFMPYPGTESFRQAKEQGILLTENWDDWDMTKPVVKLKHDFKHILKLQSDYYKISYNPRFIFNKLKRIRSIDDFKFYFRISKKVVDRFGNILNDRQTVYA